MPLRCVVCQYVSQDCLLSLSDYRKLLQSEEVQSVGMTPPTSTDSVEDVPISQNSDISVQQTDDSDGNITNHVNDDEQVSDESDVLSMDDSLSTTDSVGNKTSGFVTTLQLLRVTYLRCCVLLTYCRRHGLRMRSPLSGG